MDQRPISWKTRFRVWNQMPTPNCHFSGDRNWDAVRNMVSSFWCSNAFPIFITESILPEDITKCCQKNKEKWVPIDDI